MPSPTGRYVIEVDETMALAIMDALANNVSLHDTLEPDEMRANFVVSEEAGSVDAAYDAYQEVGRQLFDQDWGDEPFPDDERMRSADDGARPYLIEK
jgi:hypothetical protein